MYDIDAKQEGVYQRCYEEQKEEITALRAQVSALQTEAKHWRDQHANEVKRAKIIKGTGDVPLQRIQAYERMGELQGQVERLQKENTWLSGAVTANADSFDAGHKKGAESMRERAAKVLSSRMYDNMAVAHEVDRLFAAIRALPLKENEG